MCTVRQLPENPCRWAGRFRWHAALWICNWAEAAYAAPYTGAAGLLLLIPVFWIAALLFLLALSIRLSGALSKPSIARTIIAFVSFAVLSSPIVWPLVRRSLDDHLKDEATTVCQRELESTPGPFPIDGFLDETGGLKSEDVVNLLTVVGLEYIEVKFDGGMLTRAGSRESWPAAVPSGYARLELASENGDCYWPPGADRSSFFTSKRPVKPGVCMRVIYLRHPTAGHVVKMEDVPGSGLSRWALRDRTNGSFVGGFTDAWTAHYPGVPPNFHGPNECRANGISGYATLLGRVSPTEQAKSRHAELVLSSTALQITEAPGTVEDLKRLRERGQLRSIPSRSFPNSSDRRQLFRIESWEEAYSLAERHGAWVYRQNNAVILPSRSTVLELKDDGLHGKWATTGARLAKVVGYLENIVIVVTDLDGEMKWVGELQPLQPWISGVQLSFRPERFEVSESELLIHGTYGHGAGEENLKPWTVAVDLDELGS